jgi:hypothetical protein
MSKANPRFPSFLRRRPRQIRSPEYAGSGALRPQQRFLIFDIIVVFSAAHFSHLKDSG